MHELLSLISSGAWLSCHLFLVCSRIFFFLFYFSFRGIVRKAKTLRTLSLLSINQTPQIPPLPLPLLLAEPEEMASFAEAPPGDSKAGEKIFRTKCAQCHTVDKGAGHKQGNLSPPYPSLLLFLFITVNLVVYFLEDLIILRLSLLWFSVVVVVFLGRIIYRSNLFRWSILLRFLLFLSFDFVLVFLLEFFGQNCGAFFPFLMGLRFLQEKLWFSFRTGSWVWKWISSCQ